MTAEVLRYSAFPEDGAGGNPAGVVLGADTLSPTEAVPLATSRAEGRSALRAFTVVPNEPHEWAGMSPAARTVTEFLSFVRVTGDLVSAERLMAPLVPAHQHIAEHDETVERTPAEYAAHVQDMLREHGPFRFEVREMLVEEDHVFIRWHQHGRAGAPGRPHSDLPLREAGSAVYRVADGRVQEYWIQLDRFGHQVQVNAS